MTHRILWNASNMYVHLPFATSRYAARKLDYYVEFHQYSFLHLHFLESIPVIEKLIASSSVLGKSHKSSFLKEFTV
jgi:hypothetical protein